MEKKYQMIIRCTAKIDIGTIPSWQLDRLDFRPRICMVCTRLSHLDLVMCVLVNMQVFLANLSETKCFGISGN